MALDAYSNWTNPNGWGVYANTINLILNYEGGWQQLSPTSGGLVNGTFQSFTFNIAPHAAAIVNPALSYSIVSVAWHVGTWADDGLDNGTQTLAIDNINVIPEPMTMGLMAFAGAGIAFIRRRLMK